MNGWSNLNWNQHMTRRRAFSLVELLLTIGIGTTLMMLAVNIVHESMRLSSVSNRLQHNDRVATQFARQLRIDVQRSLVAQLNGQSKVELKHSDSTEIAYASEQNFVVRTVTQGDETLQHEKYQFGPGMSVQFANLESPKRISATVLRANSISASEPRIDRQISATVGRMSKLHAAQTNPPGAPKP